MAAFDHGRYVDDINMRTRGRKPFITAKGNLGLGRLEPEKGDRVAIFSGFPVPYIVREIGENRYQLIGETYLHGFMDGEAMDGDPKTQKIHLV